MDTKAQEAFVEEIKALVEKGATEIAIEATIQNEEAVALLAAQFVNGIQQYSEMLVAHEAQKLAEDDAAEEEADAAHDEIETDVQEDALEENVAEEEN